MMLGLSTKIKLSIIELITNGRNYQEKLMILVLDQMDKCGSLEITEKVVVMESTDGMERNTKRFQAPL